MPNIKCLSLEDAQQQFIDNLMEVSETSDSFEIKQIKLIEALTNIKD